MKQNERIGTPSVLWIGGAQWSGKSSVSRILADRYGLQPYEHDYHDSRGHRERAERRPDLYPAKHRAGLQSLDEAWVLRTPEQMAAEDQAIFDDRFRMTIEDLSQLPPEPPVVAQGWGLRPRLIAPLLDSPRRAIFLVPSEEFRDRQLRSLPRAAAVRFECSDPALAQRNRLARDRLLAVDVMESARALGLRTVVVDGSLSVDETVELVEDHFRPFLPEPRPSFIDYQRREMEHVRLGDHEAAFQVALEARGLFAEQQSTTWFWVAAALVGAGRFDEALDTIEEAAQRDMAWRTGLYESPALAPIRDHPRFLAAMEFSRRRREDVGLKPELRVWAPEGRDGRPPLLLCLHGANASAGQFAELAPGLAADGWLVGCGQSSQPTAPGYYCWDDRGQADTDVEAFLEQAGDHDGRRVAIVGYSQGAAIAVRAALRGRAPLGFVGLAAAFSRADGIAIQQLARSAQPVRGVILTGDRDPWLEGVGEVHSALNRAGHDVSLEILPGRGHTLGWEMRALTPEIVGRWLRRG